MIKKLFVGNIPYSITDEDLKKLFSRVGKVEEVNVIVDRASGRSKGFSFVSMSTEEEAQKAIKELNGYDLEGRPIIVSEARPLKERGNRNNVQR